MAIIKVCQLTIFLVFLSILVQTKGLMSSRKLYDQTPSDLENRCGNCPCDNPCNQSPPLPPPPPPPPKKKPPPSNYCPPPPGGKYPPNPPYIYINGPPGNLYPVDPYYSGSSRILYMGIFPFSISSILALLLAFW